MQLPSVIAKELTDIRKRHLADGSWEPESKIQTYHDAFRRRFGPDVLARLDGLDLLETLHVRENRDSLVYWLEFKNAEEFPAHFGSIAGASALKFGIYRRTETGEWMTGSPQRQVALTIDEAVARAREHRDQLIRGTHRPSNAGHYARQCELRSSTCIRHAMPSRVSVLSPWALNRSSPIWPAAKIKQIRRGNG